MEKAKQDEWCPTLRAAFALQQSSRFSAFYVSLGSSILCRQSFLCMPILFLSFSCTTSSKSVALSFPFLSFHFKHYFRCYCAVSLPVLVTVVRLSFFSRLDDSLASSSFHPPFFVASYICSVCFFSKPALCISSSKLW